MAVKFSQGVVVAGFIVGVVFLVAFVAGNRGTSVSLNKVSPVTPHLDPVHLVTTPAARRGPRASPSHPVAGVPRMVDLDHLGSCLPFLVWISALPIRVVASCHLPRHRRISDSAASWPCARRQHVAAAVLRAPGLGSSAVLLPSFKLRRALCCRCWVPPSTAMLLLWDPQKHPGAHASFWRPRSLHACVHASKHLHDVAPAYGQRHASWAQYFKVQYFTLDDSRYRSGKATFDVRVDLRLGSTMVLRFNEDCCEANLLSPVKLILHLRLKFLWHCPVRQLRGAPAVLSACKNEDPRCLRCGHF